MKDYMSKEYGVAIKWIDGIEPQEETFWYKTESDREKAYRICRGDNKVASLWRVKR
jgi:hypothetical protein